MTMIMTGAHDNDNDNNNGNGNGDGNGNDINNNRIYSNTIKITADVVVYQETMVCAACI